MTVNETDHDVVVSLRAEIESIRARLDGNVPERCVRVDAALQEIRSDIGTIQDTLQWMWRTLAAAAISLIAALISSRIR